jgi:sec-independent protein translocase protein TatB
MFDIAPSEMLVVALVAIVFIGPKDLPRVMRFVGQWVGKGRRMANHFRSAMDEMVREAELAEMEQKWKAENERIMREHAALIHGGDTPPPVAELPAPASAHDEPGAAPAGTPPQAPAVMRPLAETPASFGERG